MFTFHIAYILEVMAIAAGLVALHYAEKVPAKLVKAAGILLVVFGVAGVICTGYFGIKYYMMGHFEHGCELTPCMPQR